MAASGQPAPVLIGRCTVCKRPFRVEIPQDVAERFGGRLRNCIPYVLGAAGMTPYMCDCRNGVRCSESATGLPECGDSFCAGHGMTAVKFAAVKATYKPELPCGGACWAAKGSNCTCSCQGKNHGGMHSTGRY